MRGSDIAREGKYVFNLHEKGKMLGRTEKKKKGTHQLIARHGVNHPTFVLLPGERMDARKCTSA